MARFSQETIECPLCNSKKQEPYLTVRERIEKQETFTIVHCPGCGLLFVNPRPLPQDLERYYPKTYYAYTPVKEKKRSKLKRFFYDFNTAVRDAVFEVYFGYPGHGTGCVAGARCPIETAFKAVLTFPLYLRMKLLGKDIKIIPFRGEGRLLDVGCGSGRDLLFYRSKGWTVTGVEPSAQACEVAKMSGLDVRCGQLVDVKLPADSFDVVYMSHSFEHLSNPVQILTEIVRILKPGGRVVLKVPNGGSIETKWFGERWFGWDAPRHLFHYTPATMKKMFEKAGLHRTAVKFDVGAAFTLRKSLTQLFEEKYNKPLKHGFWMEFLTKLVTAVLCYCRTGPMMAVYGIKK